MTINSKVISPHAMEQCLKFIYCGSIDQECLEIQVGEFFAIPIEIAVSESENNSVVTGCFENDDD